MMSSDRRTIGYIYSQPEPSGAWNALFSSWSESSSCPYSCLSA